MDTRHRAILESLSSDSAAPAWAQQVCADSLLTGSVEGVTFERHTVAPDYLEFLRAQIEISPRGPQWTDVLRARFESFRAVVGTELIRVGVKRGSEQFVAHMRADNLRIVHAEVL